MKCLNCGKSCRTPKAPNWKLWQKCYLCAIKASKITNKKGQIIRTPQYEYYLDKHKHGTGGTWLEEATCVPMAWIKVS